MKNVLLLVVLVIFLSAEACSPVRNATFRNKGAGTKADVGEKSDILSDQTGRRFWDTTLILMPDVTPENSGGAGELETMLNDALVEFDKGNYNDACEKFNHLASIVSEEDSIFYEASFYIIECIIVENRLEEAKDKLGKMLIDTKLPVTVLEKTLVRMGQIECYGNNRKQAEMYFSRLKELNPSSIYLKVANCDFLNKRN